MSLPLPGAESLGEPTGTLVVLAKAPVPGRVKTRLHTRFSPTEAAALAEAALADTLEAVAAAPVRRRVLVLDGAPGAWLPAGFDVVPQVSGGLDVRLAASFAATLSDPDEGPALLVGMDTPQLTPELLTVDWTGLDAVLGMACDGGYWAVGLRHSRPEAFLGVPMSTSSTGGRQLRRLRRLGLSVGLLPWLRDVDTPEDAAATAAMAPGSRFATVHDDLRGRRGPHPVELFEDALTGVPVDVVHAAGRQPLRAAAWTAEADPVDEALLARCEPPVLDVGCGPGRLVAALCARGLPALGVDVSAAAVRRTGARGASVLRRRVEDRLPAEGRWGTVLLADGNVGIGGDPLALLRRCAALLRPGGLLVVEADPDDDADVRDAVVLESADGRRSRPLPWARLGTPALVRTAAAAGFVLAEEWRAEGRTILTLRSIGAP